MLERVRTRMGLDNTFPIIISPYKLLLTQKVDVMLQRFHLHHNHLLGQVWACTEWLCFDMTKQVITKLTTTPDNF